MSPAIGERASSEVPIAAPAAGGDLVSAQEALLRRPRVSIRTRLIASLALCFLFCVAFALG